MNFAEQQTSSGRRIVGFGVVLAFHLLLIYALVTGLARRVVEIVRAPIETKVIEEVKKPPPPPEVVIPPPPKLEAPPPPFIPPPEIQLAVPPPVAPTITAVTPTPPPAPVTMVPAPPVPAPAPPAPPAPAAPPPAPANIGIACPKMVAPEIPRRALRESINGYVKARVTIRAGKVVNVDIVESRPHGLYDSAVRAAMSQYSCTKLAQDIVAEQEFDFKIRE